MLPRIAFTDSTDSRILEAVNQIIDGHHVSPVLIGEEDAILKAAQKSKNNKISQQHISFVSPAHKASYIDLLVQKQHKSNLTPEQAERQLSDPLYVGIVMLLQGKIDGLVSGATRPTADVVRAALQCVGPKPPNKLVSGHFLMESSEQKTANDTPFLFADCAVMPEPSARSLAAIAQGAAASYKFFTGQQPRVAMLSFSTRGSAEHPLVDRIREATDIIRKNDPALIVDGEIQADAALDAGVAAIKHASNSPLESKANVFVFPTLEAGNIGYKLVQRFSKARVAGPLLWGLNKPVSDLSRGCTTQEVMDTAMCVSAMVRGNA